MNLEDHQGDIVRKARTMAGIAPEAAAAAAGLNTADYRSFERSGAFIKEPDWSRLAEVVGLNGAKLERIAKGWLPPEQDLSRWRELRVIVTGDGEMTVNCFLAWDEVTREAALFDTGFDMTPIVRELEANELQLRHIFITHTHSDHIACLDALREKYPKAILHMDEKGALPQHKNRRNDCIHLGSLRITNRPTPGHAHDGVTYIIGNWPEDGPHVAVVGDALFAGSAGGADDWAVASKAIREQIFSLPADTLVCPGHGPLTTVADEKEHNPFF